MLNPESLLEFICGLAVLSGLGETRCRHFADWHYESRKQSSHGPVRKGCGRLVVDGDAIVTI
jgi:hypothetical protein